MNPVLNTVGLTGRLGQSPELKTTGKNGEFSYVRLSLAVNENFKNASGEWAEKTQWHNIVVWGKTAEKFANTTEKGMEVTVFGKLRNSVYGEGADKKYSTDVEIIHFIPNLVKEKEVPTAKK